MELKRILFHQIEIILSTSVLLHRHDTSTHRRCRRRHDNRRRRRFTHCAYIHVYI